MKKHAYKKVTVSLKKTFGLKESFQGVYVDGSSTRYWFVKDGLHREDGPSIEWASGAKSWHLHDIWYHEKEFLYITKYKESYKYNI